MVCKEFEELCTKFRNLSPHMRIDIMCGMLRMCLPPELRFIGSVVEDLAKKDYHFLREHEIKANSQTEIMKYKYLDDRALRRGVALSLSLLHSWNTNCANAVFDLLESSLKRAFEVTSSTDRETIDVILLVLMMAMNHPALSFHQKQVIASHYEIVEKQLESLFTKTECVDMNISTTSTITSSPLVTTSNCPTCSGVSTVKPAVVTPQSPTSQNKVHICNIEMKTEKMTRRHERRHEYRFQVKWSNGNVNDVSKTQLELRDFHSRLVKLYPEEAGAHKQDRKLPFLGLANMGHREELDHISDYVSKLVKLPKHILECEHVAQFFKGGNSSLSSPEASQPSKEPICSSAPQSPVQMTPPIASPQNIDPNSVIYYQPSRTLTVYNSHLFHHHHHHQHQQHHHYGEATPPVCDTVTPADTQMDGEGAELEGQLSPPLSSRLPVNSSPVHSPQIPNHIPPEDNRSQLLPNHIPTQDESIAVITNHISSPEECRSQSPNISSPEISTINSLMKKLNINRQNDSLDKLTLEQLGSMNYEDLVKLGLSKEEADKLLTEVEVNQNRMKSVPPNGLIEPCIPSATVSPSIIPWPAAPQAQCIALHYQDHIPPQPTFAYQPHLPYIYPIPSNVSAPGHIRTRNSSPTGSDYSSPSPSPVPQKKASSQLKLSDCSSGEENDKDRPPTVESPTVEGKNRYNSTHLIDNGRYTGVNGKHLDDKKTLVHVPTAMPPPVYMASGSIETSSVQVPVGCGYQSDPTPTGFAPPRIPTVIPARPPYKAQPAHVSMNIPPKNMISMPPDTHPGKRCTPMIPIAYAPPIPRCESSTMTNNVVTAVAGNPMFSMAPSDVAKRQVVYGIPVQSAIPLNGNGNRPVTCTVTTSTAIVMATRQANSGSPHQHVAVSSSVQGNGMVHSASENSISSQSDNPSIHNSTPIVPNNNVSTVNAPVARTCSASPNQHQSSVATHSSCNNCNCNCHVGGNNGGGGNNGNNGNGASGVNIQHQYPGVFPNHFAPGNIAWHWPYLATHTSNGLIPHMYPPNVSYHIHPSNYHNGLNPDVLNNHHGYTGIAPGIFPMQYPSLGSLLSRGGAVFNHSSNRSNGNGKKTKKNCFNCGSVDHNGSECSDKSMESVSGHYHLNYEPKSNSD